MERVLPRLAAALWLVACVLGTLARVAGTGELVLHGDEPVALDAVERGYAAIWTSFDGRGTHAGFALLQRASVDLFGWSAGAYRLPSVVAGVLALWLLYPLVRPLAGAGPAWLATLVLAGNALHVYQSRNGRPYALAFLLVLVLLAATDRALSGRRRAWLAVALVAGVLPWVHLTAAGPVAGVALASVAWTARVRRGTRECVAAFGGGALLTALLYAPAAPELARYVAGASELAHTWSVRWSGIADVIGGTRALGWWILAGGSAGLVVLAARAWRGGSAGGILLAAAGLAPLVVLALARPRGSHVAGARYLVVALGPLLCGAAALVFAVARGRAWLSGALGLALVALQLARGQLDRTWWSGTLASAPELLESRYALSRPFAGTPAFYRDLAREPGELTLVEYPSSALGVLLFRNYALQHGQRVLLGTVDESPLHGVEPYAPVSDLADLRARADWLIVHLDLAREAEPFRRAAGLPHIGQRAPVLAGAAERMLAALGEPAYRDGVLWAWHFERDRDGGAVAHPSPPGLLSSPR